VIPYSLRDLDLRDIENLRCDPPRITAHALRQAQERADSVIYADALAAEELNDMLRDARALPGEYTKLDGWDDTRDDKAAKGDA
jgi:hypothetical protein